MLRFRRQPLSKGPASGQAPSMKRSPQAACAARPARRSGAIAEGIDNGSCGSLFLLCRPWNCVPGVLSGVHARFNRFPIHYYEEGIQRFATTLRIRQIIASHHWLGDSQYSMFDVMQSVLKSMPTQLGEL